MRDLFKNLCRSILKICKSFFLILRRVLFIPRRIGQLLILAYQYTISPDHGPMAKYLKYRVCRYEPTCSEYGYIAIGKYGLLRGCWMAFFRILRCTPWHAGGHDPVM